jgi:guanylate kinase
VILEIDVQGALQVKAKMPQAYMIFVLPPTDQELLARLRRRGRDNEQAIQRRFAQAKAEIQTARQSGAYEFIVNDDLERTVEQACEMVERRRKATCGS